MLVRLYLRSIMGAARGTLGLPSLAAAGGAGPGLLVRHFADQPEATSQPEAAPADGDSAVAVPAAEEEGDEGDALEAAESADEGGVGISPEELELYSKRQQAYLGVDPDKYKHFLPKLSRAELGSYADEEFQDEFEEEFDYYPKIPENKPLYNLRDAVPELWQPKCAILDKIKELKADHPEMTVDEVLEGLGLQEGSSVPPRPGAQPILRWETRLVMAVGVDEPHPANRKARLRVYLRDLQREAGLSEAAVQYIAHICGPRYNPCTGDLLLTSEKYSLREDNRRHIMEMLVGLVEEGNRAYPQQQQSEQQQRQQRGQAQVAA